MEGPSRSLSIVLAVALYPRILLSGRASAGFPQGLGRKVGGLQDNSTDAVLGALACPSVPHHKLSDELAEGWPSLPSAASLVPSPGVELLPAPRGSRRKRSCAPTAAPEQDSAPGLPPRQ